MQNENRSLDGIHLVAMKDGQPVANQAEVVTALLNPLVAAVRKSINSGSASPESNVQQTPVPDREKYIEDLEIECATLRHGLRLADRRYEELAAVARQQD